MTDMDLLERKMKVLRLLFKEEEKIVSFFLKLLEKGDFKGKGDFPVAIKAIITRKVFDSVNHREIPSRVTEYLWLSCGIDRSMAFYILEDLYEKMLSKDKGEYILSLTLDLRKCSVLDKEVLTKFLSLCLITDSPEKHYSITDVVKLLERYGKVA